MITFQEWLNEVAGIATSKKQFKQGDKPSFAGAGSDLGEIKHHGKKKSKKEGAAGIATNCNQFKQGDKPNFAGSGSNMGCKVEKKSAKKTKAD